eukprot:6186998-Pleurochrysis_carterae.AAC.1
MLSETSKYDSVIEDLRRELSIAISELKQEKKRARTLKRVEYYGDDDEDHPTAMQHAQTPPQPTLRQENDPPPPMRNPPWQRTQSFSHNPFNTY